MVTSFKYLGWVILAADEDWPALVKNLAWTKTIWSRMLRILIREGAMPRLSGFFFKDVIQALLIFGAENWVVTSHIGKVLGGFQTEVERRMTGHLPWRTTDMTWIYTSAAATREAAGFLKMEEYTRRLQNTVTQYIYTRSLLELCEGSERYPGA